MQLQLQLLIAVPSATTGGVVPPLPTNHLLTEASDNFVTEGGDNFVTE